MGIDRRTRRHEAAEACRTIVRLLHETHEQFHRSAVTVIEPRMASIHLYCDEAGNMPVSDADDAFVAAIIVAVAPIGANLPQQRSNPEWTARLLKSCGAIPSCAYVKPHDGYGRALKRKMDIIRFVGGADKRLGRPRQPGRSYEALRPRNYVWMLSMEVAIQMAFLPLALRTSHSVDEVRVFLNSKTLDPELGAFFQTYLREAGDRMKDSLRQGQNNLRIPKSLRQQAADAVGRVGVPADHVYVEWDTALSFSGLAGGVCLADSLASHVQAELRTENRKHGIFYELSRIGIRGDYLVNVTDEVCKINIADFRAWEAETGLKIPGL